MPAYHITGPSGSGKSTVGRLLQQRGYRVIETDFEPGLSSWVNNDTREKVTETPPQPFPKQWVAAHGWIWDKAKMSELFEEIGTDPVFFVGGAHNEKDYEDWFDKGFGLSVDGPTLVKRLQPREPERWADGSTELQNLMNWNERFKDYCRSMGVVLIDSSKSPEEVTDNILAHISTQHTEK
jgi:adenylate kinase family enzyme